MAYFGIRGNSQREYTRNPKKPKHREDEQNPTGHDRHSEQICICSPNLVRVRVVSRQQYTHLVVVNSDLVFLHAVVQNNVGIVGRTSDSVERMMGIHKLALTKISLQVTCPFLWFPQL